MQIDKSVRFRFSRTRLDHIADLVIHTTHVRYTAQQLLFWSVNTSAGEFTSNSTISCCLKAEPTSEHFETFIWLTSRHHVLWVLISLHLPTLDFLDTVLNCSCSLHSDSQVWFRPARCPMSPERKARLFQRQFRVSWAHRLIWQFRIVSYIRIVSNRVLYCTYDLF